MTMRTIVVIILALLCGAAMSVGILRNNAGGASSRGISENTEFVVVAARPLPVCHQITEEDLELRSCSKDWLTEGTLRKKEDAVGQLARVRLFAGDVITADKLTGEEEACPISVSPGMRAYTIQTPRVASNVAGFIMPGNKVDVLLNLKGSRGDATGGGSTTTLLQAIKVLAVAQYLEAPEDYKVVPDEMSSVTLEVTPQQANDLDLGQNMGVLTLSLRNPTDDTSVETFPSTISDIQFLTGKALGIPEDMDDEPRPPEPEAVAPKQPEPVWIVTLRGRHRGRLMVGEGRGQ